MSKEQGYWATGLKKCNSTQLFGRLWQKGPFQPLCLKWFWSNTLWQIHHRLPQWEGCSRLTHHSLASYSYNIVHIYILSLHNFQFPAHLIVARMTNVLEWHPSLIHPSSIQPKCKTHWYNITTEACRKHVKLAIKTTVSF